MRLTGLRLVGTVVVAVALSSGCSSDPSPGPGAAGSAATGGGTGVVPSCEGALPCGGSVVGTWKVASSCLKLSGNLDTSLFSLGCETVPVNGTLQATGTFVANADGTYDDNTTTTGSMTTTLDAPCLSVSSVAVTCERVGGIFTAAGWGKADCKANANSGCDCTFQIDQKGGLGMVVPFTEPEGRYTTSGTKLTVSNADYQYCGSSNALTLTPQSSALSGSIVLTHDGSGSGGSGNVGGQATGGAGGQATGGGGQATGGGGQATGGVGGQGAGGVGGQMGGSGGGGGTGGTAPVGMRPCDIYGAANNKCVAAHSTVRALFAAYSGALYQVKRADGMTKDIPVKTTGGFADSAQQDTFCQGTSCTIWRVYDQSDRGNFLEAETPDSSVKGAAGQTAAKADAESLMVGGNKVYSLFTRPRQAYWRDGSKTGVPVGAEPEGLYMVTSGTHFNGGCCYNYGNGQLSRKYEGGPTMDAIYFGNNTIWGTGAGNGPWVMADMEDGMLSGKDSGHNPALPSMPYKYVTAIVKNNGTTDYALRGADATGATLSTFYSGALPPGKRPMRKQGAIVLGSGGDCCLTNNNLSEGTFYEGAIVTGFPSDATENEVHKNIYEAGYGK